VNFGVGSRASFDTLAERRRNEPGPGHYGFADKRQKGLEFTLGHAISRNVDDGVPGPGMYKTRQEVGRSSSMAKLTHYSAHLKESAMKPGAGAYSPDKEILKRNPGYSLGREKQRVNKNFDRMVRD